MEKYLTKKNVTIAIIMLFIIRILIGYFYYNYDDLLIFNFTWVDMIDQKGLFGIYTVPITTYFKNVDYPPLFIILL